MSLAESAGKLVSDTVYGIQKDVMKIALLALASLAYRGAKQGVGIGRMLLQGCPPLIAATAFAAVAVVLVNALNSSDAHISDHDGSYAEHALASPIGATVRGLRSAARYTASHPFSVGSMLAAAFVIDRLELLAGLERVLKHWLELVLPALHKKFILGRAARAAAPRDSRWPSTRVALGALVPAWLVQHGVAVSRARAARALLESQQAGGPFAWWRGRHEWQVERWVQLGSAVFGMGSAIKYLLTKAPRRLR